MIGLIRTAYREEVSTLTKWCQENHLLLNIDKTKELVVDFRRQSREHTHITIDKTPVERVNSFKFLAFTSLRISHDLLTQMQCWRRHINASSSWDGWGSLEWASASSDPSTPALYPDRLHHRLVWKQHRWQPQSSAKGRANCPPHFWRWASLPPGHLHQAVCKESPEDHQGVQPPFPQSALSAALKKTSPQHPEEADYLPEETDGSVRVSVVILVSRCCLNICCLNCLLAARKEYFISYLFLLCIFDEVYIFDCTYW